MGWVVPDSLRGRWHLRLGDARTELPALLRDLGEIDVFFHDSLHTYDHMAFELHTAWPYLTDGGVIIADDALWNGAFLDCAEHQWASRWAVVRGVGVAKKVSTLG